MHNSCSSCCKIAAVVVLYDPGLEVTANVQSYVDQVDVVYLVDNSETEASHLHELKAHPRVIYLPNGTNLGIATALNMGAKRALAEGYQYLLTMDQDSTATEGMVDTLLCCLEPEEMAGVGIISPFHLTDIDDYPCGVPRCEDTLTAWTSGNLLNLKIYREVGPFRDDFFIDFVDHEFCLRLQAMGYRVVQCNQAVLRHCIGSNLTKNKFLHLTLITSNHSALRKYYITRNRLWVRKNYRSLFPQFTRIDDRRLVAELVNIFFFEQDRLNKYQMIWRGFRDYRQGKMGRFSG